MKFTGKAQIRFQSGETIYVPASEWGQTGERVIVTSSHFRQEIVLVLWDERNDGQEYTMRLDEHGRPRVGNQSATWSKAVVENLTGAEGVVVRP